MTTTNTEWELRDGLDPTHLRQALADHTRNEEERRAANLAAFKKEEARARAELEQSAETFRTKLGQILGTDVPADAIRIIQYSDTPITSRILTLEEIKDTSWPFSDVRPSRELTAVWTDTDHIHIHVTGDPQNRRSSGDRPNQVQTWNAGPVETTEDLAHIVYTRGGIRWAPPAQEETTPTPPPEPTTSSAAERAQELLTALSANPRNQRGLRGALIALAWSNLAASHNRT